MANKDNDIEWFTRRTGEYCLAGDDIKEAVEDFDEVGKLG
jgi:hypothetical protein